MVRGRHAQIVQSARKVYLFKRRLLRKSGGKDFTGNPAKVAAVTWSLNVLIVTRIIVRRTTAVNMMPVYLRNLPVRFGVGGGAFGSAAGVRMMPSSPLLEPRGVRLSPAPVSVARISPLNLAFENTGVLTVRINFQFFQSVEDTP